MEIQFKIPQTVQLFEHTASWYVDCIDEMQTLYHSLLTTASHVEYGSTSIVFHQDNNVVRLSCKHVDGSHVYYDNLNRRLLQSQHFPIVYDYKAYNHCSQATIESLSSHPNSPDVEDMCAAIHDALSGHWWSSQAVKQLLPDSVGEAITQLQHLQETQQHIKLHADFHHGNLMVRKADPSTIVLIDPFMVA